MLIKDLEFQKILKFGGCSPAMLIFTLSIFQYPYFLDYA